MKRYSDAQAVRDALESWIPGTQLTGKEIVARTYHNLMVHGSPCRPMDTTIMRSLRREASRYGIVARDRSKSLYYRQPEEPAARQ